MKKTILTICIIFLVAASAIFSYKLGVSHGFGIGYAYESTHSAPLRGVETVTALENLRAGKIEKAIKSLEMSLDGSIMVYYSGTSDFEPPEPYLSMFPNNKESERKIMVRVAKYRKENPSPIQEPQVKNTVDSAIKYFLQKNDF